MRYWLTLFVLLFAVSVGAEAHNAKYSCRNYMGGKAAFLKNVPIKELQKDIIIGTCRIWIKCYNPLRAVSVELVYLVDKQFYLKWPEWNIIKGDRCSTPRATSVTLDRIDIVF